MDSLQKKLLYQATHRGLKEADVLLGRGIQPFLNTPLPEEERLFLEALLDLPDPMLMDWLLRGRALPESFQGSPFCDRFRSHALGSIV
ncbi:MAG: succinate dehydrogenase assembly factor 2 [Alphaproteobacteria bacterium]